MKKYSCLIVEDEPLAQRVLVSYISRYPQLELLGCCRTAGEAEALLQKKPADLLLLDINLPDMTGIAFLRKLTVQPKVIFITAYSEYAVTSYELDAVDYLVKPVTPERFNKSIQKFLNGTIKEKPVEEKLFIFLKVNSQLRKVYFRELLYVEARKDYLMVYLPGESLLTHMTVKALDALLPQQQFLRIHRSYIINKDHVTGVGLYEIEIKGKKLPVGESYREAVVRDFFRKEGRNNIHGTGNKE